jgi:hypothetical protein
MFFLIALVIYLIIAAGILALQVILEKRLFRFMTAGRAR